MTVSHIEMLATKIKLIGEMYDFLGQDEDAYADWVVYFPDEPNDEEVLQMATEDWVEACRVFGEIVKAYNLS